MLHVPQYKTASGQRSFRYRAVKIWNTTDDNLKNLLIYFHFLDVSSHSRYIIELTGLAQEMINRNVV